MRNLESDYDCSRASEDLQGLQAALEQLERENGRVNEEERNRIRNQIEFIKNKCSIRP
jgi:ElaB/YqjD/DUF883 family membrane-anchored ribosome-binding protein